MPGQPPFSTHPIPQSLYSPGLMALKLQVQETLLNLKRAQVTQAPLMLLCINPHHLSRQRLSVLRLPRKLLCLRHPSPRIGLDL